MKFHNEIEGNNKVETKEELGLGIAIVGELRNPSQFLRPEGYTPAPTIQGKKKTASERVRVHKPHSNTIDFGKLTTVNK